VHSQGIWSACYSPDGLTLCLASGDSTASLIEVATGVVLRKIEGVHSEPIRSACYSPDGETLCLASYDTTASLIQVSTGAVLRKIDGVHSQGIRSACFSPDGLTLCLASRDTTASLLDLSWLPCVSSEGTPRWLDVHITSAIALAAASDAQLLTQLMQFVATNQDTIDGPSIIQHSIETGNQLLFSVVASSINLSVIEAVRASLRRHNRTLIGVALKAQPPNLACVQQLFALLTKVWAGNDGSHAVHYLRTTSTYAVHYRYVEADDLALTAKVLPSHLVDLIETLERPFEEVPLEESTLFSGLRMIETLTQRLEDFDVRSSNKDGVGKWLVADQIRGGTYEGTDDTEAAARCVSTLQVLALPGFVAAPARNKGKKITLPPFTRVFNAALDANLPNSDYARLMRTKLFRTITAFKWNAYAKRRVQTRLVKYGAHLMVGAAAMAVSAQTGSNNNTTANVLQGAVLASNTVLVLRDEVVQVIYVCKGSSLHEKLAGYLGECWNWFNIIGIVSIYGAAAAHYSDAQYVLRPVGAVGVLANAFSLLELLKPFDKTGPLIKILLEILVDIVPFLKVAGILLLGFSNAFAVLMPASPDYNFNFDVGGDGSPFSGFLTVYISMLGTFDLNQYTGWEATLMFILYLFLIVVVMMNLLIAIMSDSYERVSLASFDSLALHGDAPLTAMLPPPCR
jgi:hypothetical protein